MIAPRGVLFLRMTDLKKSQKMISRNKQKVTEKNMRNCLKIYAKHLLLLSETLTFRIIICQNELLNLLTRLEELNKQIVVATYHVT
jgi:hypothetical protein